MFSVTVVMAQSYNFSLMTENVKNTSYVRKNGDSAYAGVNVTSLSCLLYTSDAADEL